MDKKTQEICVSLWGHSDDTLSARAYTEAYEMLKKQESVSKVFIHEIMMHRPLSSTEEWNSEV